MKPPNIVIFMPEQWRGDALGCLGHPRVQTPNFDRMAETGTVFSNCFTPHPVCGPSRVCFATGWYPHTRGHRTQEYLIGPDEPNFFAQLKEKNYHVMWFGKNDMIAPEIALGCMDVTYKPGRAAGKCRNPWPKDDPRRHSFYWGKCEGPHLDDLRVDEAISLLRRGFPEPFCCFLPLSLVHPPYAVDEPWFSMYDPEKIDEIIPPPATGKATHFDAVHRATGMDAGGDALARKLRACYYGMMSKQDANFGRLVDVLEETGLADRTATLFMADHGNYAGDFGSPTKWWSGTEDSLLRVPCAIRLPGGEQEAGIRDGMIQTLDVARTLLELAGVDPEWPHFGRSLVAGMTGGESVRREAVFADSGFTPDHENPATLERSGLPRTRPSGTYYAWRRLGEERPELFARARTVRTQQWKYVWRAAESDELYDLAADPQERRNLLYKDADAYHDRVAEMRSLMLDWSIRCGDVVPPRCHD